MASAGLGAEVCRQLAERNYSPIIGYRRAGDEHAQTLASETGGYPVQLELSAPESIVSAVEEIAARKSGITGIILAASPPPMLVPITRVAGSVLLSYFQVNVIGHQFLLACMLKSFLRSQKSGRILVVLSEAMGEATERPMPLMGSYNISKWGLKGLLWQFASEHNWL